jgi:uncharacterized protein (TIGR02466 family)
MQTEGTASPAAAGRLMREIYFPTVIYFLDVPDAASLNDAMKAHIYAWRAQDGEGIVRSNVRRTGAWHSRLDMHQRVEYQGLVDQVLAAARPIYEEMGYDAAYEPAIDNMWANVNPRHAFNRSHIHPNVLWSGVYYVQAPPGAGRIYFTDPRAQAQAITARFAPDTPRNPLAWSEVYFEPVEGRILLFPAWLMHEVEPNLTELEGPAADRISVSFNLIQRRRTTSGDAGTS